jgi:predicted phage-related endonuclease
MNAIQNALQFDQGTDAWLRAKLGVISASNISKVLAKKGTDTRSGYLAELIGQICTGQMDELNAKALDFGKVNESAARASYEFESGNKVEQVGFIYGPGQRTGCSPDGMITKKNKGVEIKVPYTSKVFIEFLTMGKIKKEYQMQCQFSLWVTGFDTWDFVNFNPRMKKNMLHFVTIERDEKTMELFNEAIPEFVSEMDALLAVAGFKFGDQWE